LKVWVAHHGWVETQISPFSSREGKRATQIFPSPASPLSLHRAAMEAGAAAPPHASRPARREQGQPPPGADSPPQIRAPAASSPGHGGAHPRASSSVSAVASAQASSHRPRAAAPCRWLRQRLGVRPSSSALTAALMELQLLAKHKLGKDLGQGERRRREDAFLS